MNYNWYMYIFGNHHYYVGVAAMVTGKTTIGVFRVS